MISNKIKTLFLSAQPCVIAALLTFFCNDPSITFLGDDYNNFDDVKKCKRSYDVVVFDDLLLCSNEIEKYGNSFESKKILYTGINEQKYLQYFVCNGFKGIISKKSNFETIRKAIIKN